MKKNTKRRICVLGPEDVELLRVNIIPNCRDHTHVKKVDAMEMTGRGDFKPYFTPIAEWVGPNHIRILKVHAIRGLSTKIGKTHEAALRRKEPWARIMLDDIHGKRIYDRETREYLMSLDVRGPRV
jgi:hypothetical protein